MCVFVWFVCMCVYVCVCVWCVMCVCAVCMCAHIPIAVLPFDPSAAAAVGTTSTAAVAVGGGPEAASACTAAACTAAATDNGRAVPFRISGMPVGKQTKPGLPFLWLLVQVPLWITGGLCPSESLACLWENTHTHTHIGLRFKMAA